MKANTVLVPSLVNLARWSIKLSRSLFHWPGSRARRRRAIEILRTVLDRTLRLLGCPSVTDLDRSYVNVPKSWAAD
jgi:hypothetical protein